jgi:hypothetical protein
MNTRRTHWRPGAIGLITAALTVCCGCLKVKEHLTIREDGSGTVRIETQSSVPADQLGAMSEGWMAYGEQGESGAWLAYPPLAKAAARNLFPGKEFTVTVAESKNDAGEPVVTVEAAFRDINALLASPYGKAHALTLRSDGKTLAFRGLSGLHLMAQMLGLKDDAGIGMGALMAMQPDWQKQKNRLAIEFTLTLPKDVAAANGSPQGRNVTWTLDRAQMKDDAEAAKAFRAVFEASCPAEGLAFTPNSPVRLALLPFAELAAGPTGGTSQLPDEKKVAAQARFVPARLQVTRSVDLSGSGYAQNQATLTGVVLVPKEFAPQRWGATALDKVIDEKGNNLALADDDRMSRFGHITSGFSGMSEEETDETEEAALASADSRKVVTFIFKAPDWKAKEIARIEGSVELQYLGGSEIVKLEKAIPKEWIGDMSRGRFGSFDGTERSLSNPRLTEVGLPLKLAMAMRTGGMLTISLQSEGESKQSALAEAQVFDAEGNPWPCFVHSQQMKPYNHYQIMVAGDPPAPLSLALLVSSVGATVKVPIRLEHVPLAVRADKPEKED